jgi:hypothetical protein
MSAIFFVIKPNNMNMPFLNLFSLLAPTSSNNYYIFLIYLIIILLLYFLSLKTLIFLLDHVGRCSFYYFSFLRLDLTYCYPSNIVQQVIKYILLIFNIVGIVGLVGRKNTPPGLKMTFVSNFQKDSHGFHH